MRRCLYVLLALAGMLTLSQSVDADWYAKINPKTGLAEYFWDPTEDWPENPPGPGRWVIVRDYVNFCWIAYPAGGQ